MDTLTEQLGPYQGPPPDSLRLCEMALAAGLVGVQLAVWFRDYPAHVLARLWAYLAARVDPASVLQLDGAGALRKLRVTPGDYSLVLVRDVGLYTEAAWATRLATRSTGAARRPTIFTTAAPDPADNPATTLTLYPHPDELQRLDWMLDAVPGDGPEILGSQPLPPDVEKTALRIFVRAVDPALASARDRDVIWALYYGALALQDWGADPSAWASAAYAAMYHSLQGKTARPADEDFNPIAVAMVGRANVYLRIAADLARSGDAAPLRLTGVTAGVTRRELVDLGLPHGKSVRTMVEHLRAANCLADYCRLGLAGTTLPTNWPGNDLDALCGRLVGWSEKMVRTHFDRLLKLKEIEGTRDAGNAAWTYHLPETLSARRRAFDALPDPTAVAAVALAVEQELSAACPACPPPAQPAGQADVACSRQVSAADGSVGPSTQESVERNGPNPALAPE